MPARVNDDLHTTDPSTETPLYQEAARIRQALRAAGEAPSRTDGMQVYPAGTVGAPPRPKARPIVRFRAKEDLVLDEREGTITVVGDVYVSQGLIKSGDFLEIELAGSFEATVAIGYFEYLRDPLAHLQRMKELTQGELVISFPKRYTLRTLPRAVRYRLRGWWLHTPRDENKKR